MSRYLGKAKDLLGKGKWNLRLTCGRTPEQSAQIRAGPGCEPNSFCAKAEKLNSAVINHIVPMWWLVQEEQHSGWDESEKVKETFKRYEIPLQFALEQLLPKHLLDNAGFGEVARLLVPWKPMWIRQRDGPAQSGRSSCSLALQASMSLL